MHHHGGSAHFLGCLVNDPACPAYLAWLTFRELLGLRRIHKNASLSILAEIGTRAPEEMLHNSHEFITSKDDSFLSALLFINTHLRKPGEVLCFGVERVNSPTGIYCTLIDASGQLFSARAFEMTMHAGDPGGRFMIVGEWLHVCPVNQLLSFHATRTQVGSATVLV